MNKKQQDILQQNQSTIVEAVASSFEIVLSKLRIAGLFSAEEETLITSSYKMNEMRVLRMLESLPSKDDGFSVFIAALKQTGIQRLADLLEHLENTSLGKNAIYEMSSTPKGLGLFISNRAVEDGSMAFLRLFGKFGFHAEYQFNLTYSQMEAVIGQFAARSDHAGLGSVVLYVSAFAQNNENFYGTDVGTGAISIASVLEMFSSECKLPRERPRLFFFELSVDSDNAENAKRGQA